MASNIISDFFSSAALVITKEQSSPTAQTTAPSQVVAASLAVSKVKIRLRSKLLKHMMEDGSSYADTRIILPTEIDIEAFAPDNDTIDQVNSILRDRGAFYTVSSKGVTVESVMFEGVQLSQTSEMTTSTPVRLAARQALSSSSKSLVLAQSQDSNIINRGMAILGQAENNINSLYNKISGLF